jgi:CRP-like cAMP-binding protein
MTADRGEPLGLSAPRRSRTAALEAHIDRVIGELIASCPEPSALSAEERRGIIARYTAVLEPNFIYWMSATYLAVASETARAIARDNLREEIRDNHPGMLRRFALAARALPTDADQMAVHSQLREVRGFVGRMTALRLVVMMAFFEGFITRFMPYLADLARRQGSTEQEYTDVHGVVDVQHTRELFRALDAEIAHAPTSVPAITALLEGVDMLRTLIEQIIHARADEELRLGRRITTGVSA